MSTISIEPAGASSVGALTRYEAMAGSIGSRKAAPPVRTGLDAGAVRVRLRVTQRLVRTPLLLREAAIVDALAPNLRALSEGSLDERVADVRTRFLRGRVGEDDTREALALVREVARRETGQEAYVVQLAAAMGLVRGGIAEMVTGEGKTLTGSVAAPLLAWSHRTLHVFTVNDYLAARDAESRAPLYKRLGLTCGAITQELDEAARASVYTRPIVYGTPKQITADYLRDQLRLGGSDTAWTGRERGLRSGVGPIVPGLRAALVDEADAVLIDEGIVPLIIAQSRTEDEQADLYREACKISQTLDEGPDFKIDARRRRAELARRGRHRCQAAFERLLEHGGNPIWRATKRSEELIRRALVAEHCYKRGQQYEIVDGRVVIVDEFTGRFLPDRTWEHGLHQAVEAKEGLEVAADRETLARLSFQRFFRSYRFLAGMTGTAADATGEMESVYGRRVVVIPTHRPVRREVMPRRVFAQERDKLEAVADSASELSRAGRPILIGTRSIEASEIVASLLRDRGIECRVLNAHHDADEASMISEAGRVRMVTVATNMAGRGTDIVPDRRAIELGGLHVILTEMHAARRVDRQFIGRAARQGDPGSSQVFVSLEDELIRLNAGGSAKTLLRVSNERELTEQRVAQRLCDMAQRRAERRARSQRASVLRQDDWVEQHLPGR
ncbi:MAG: hypothetical protein AAGG07_09910 [Planctomycetota bacterium]